MNERNKGQLSNPQQNQKALEAELLLLSTYIKRCPHSIQKQLLPYCYELKKEFPNDLRIKDLNDLLLGDADTRPESTSSSQNLIRNLFRILQLKLIPNSFNKTIEKIEIERLKPQPKSKQQIFGKNYSFDKVDLLYPEYDNYYKMSKQEREHHLPQHHPKNKFKEFYSDPRFLVRIEELAHFRSNQKLKGDILFLHYEGNIITGNKTYAVAKDNSIEVWEMESNAYPIPILTIATQNDENQEKKNEVEDKKQKEVKPQIPPGTKFCLNNVYNGHTEKITSLSFSLDEYYLITGSVDRTIKLWCLRLKTCLCTYRGHRKTIWDVQFSPSGYYFLSGSSDGFMILWKTDEPHAQRVFHHQSDVYKVSFAKDPTFAISAGQDSTIKIWKVVEGEILRELRLNRPVINFNLGFSGSMLVSIENDGKITIFDLLKGDMINSFYFYEDKKNKQDDKTVINKMRIHDVCLSEDERELSCVTSKYVVIYSMDRLEMKVNNNIFTFFDANSDSNKITRLPPKEIIYMGIETNLTYCSYQHKNVLVVAGNGRT